MKKRIIAMVLLLVVTLTLAIAVSTCFADSVQDPLDRLETEMKSKEANDIAWSTMSPALKIFAVVMFILGIVAIAGAVGYAGIIVCKMIFGKAKFGKAQIAIFSVALVAGLLLSGGSWFGVLKFANKTIVKPVNERIIQPEANKSDTGTNIQKK